MPTRLRYKDLRERKEVSNWLRTIAERVQNERVAENREYFYAQTDKIFFWGHPLTEIYQRDVFRKLPRYTESAGFCYISAALAMFALRDEPTARLVQGDIFDPENVYHHGWVEYKHAGNWYVVDFAWLDDGRPVLRREYDYWFHPHRVWTAKYHEFWSHPTTKALEHFLRSPETSHIFGGLYAYAGCWRKGGIEVFSPKQHALISDPDHGTTRKGSPVFLLPDGNPLHPVCRTAINELLKADEVPKEALEKIEGAMAEQP